MARLDQMIDISDGPWSGMVDSIAPTARREGKYLLGQNIYPLDPAIGDGVVGRPGCRVIGAQLGSPGRQRVQGIYQFTKFNGTEYTVAVVGGYFYALTWGSETWVEVLTAAQLGAAGISLSQSATVAFATFSNELVVSDGINTPWTWDGTTGAGLTKLTNAPVFYGQPTVHQGRLFGIDAGDPATMMWSEVDDATIGYASGGYTNAWNFTQTDPHRLYRIQGANEGLYVFRANSASIATGSVSTSFASQSSKEGISETSGTMSPFAFIFTGTTIMLLDAYLHPQTLRAGGVGFDPIWSEFRETLKLVPKTPTTIERCMAVAYPPAGLALMAVPGVGQTECTMLLVYDVKSAVPTPVAIWRGWEMTALAMVKSATASANGQAVLFHGDSTGYVYLHGNPEDSGPWDDQLASGTVPIEHIIECQALGYSTKREKIFDRIDIAVRALSRMTLLVNTISSRGASPPQTITVDSGVAGWDNALWDEMVWDVDVSLSTQEAHGDVGIDVEARWIKPRIRHQTLNEQFGVVGLTVLAYGEDDDPQVP